MNLGADYIELPSQLTLKVTEKPAELAVLIANTRGFARIDSGIDDDLVKDLIQAGTEKIEAYINRKLINQTVEAHWGCGASVLKLPYGNVSGTPVVSLGQEDGTFITTTDFVLKGSTIYLNDTDFSDDVKVSYITGYGANHTLVPYIIKEHIYRYVISAYDNRENFVVGESVNLLPNNLMSGLRLFINYESF